MERTSATNQSSVSKNRTSARSLLKAASAKRGSGVIASSGMSRVDALGSIVLSNAFHELLQSVLPAFPSLRHQDDSAPFVSNVELGALHQVERLRDMRRKAYSQAIAPSLNRSSHKVPSLCFYVVDT